MLKPLLTHAQLLELIREQEPKVCNTKRLLEIAQKTINPGIKHHTVSWCWINLRHQGKVEVKYAKGEKYPYVRAI